LRSLRTFAIKSQQQLRSRMHQGVSKVRFDARDTSTAAIVSIQRVIATSMRESMNECAKEMSSDVQRSFPRNIVRKESRNYSRHLSSSILRINELKGIKTNCSTSISWIYKLIHDYNVNGYFLFYVENDFAERYKILLDTENNFIGNTYWLLEY